MQAAGEPPATGLVGLVGLRSVDGHGSPDTGEALVTACAPGAEARRPALYAKARDDGDRSVRTETFDAMATGQWELTAVVCAEGVAPGGG